MPLLPSASVPPVPPAIVREIKEPRTSPEIAALLPPPVIVGGYKIEFLDSGFSAPKDSPHFDLTNSRSYSRAAYFFTYRVSRADGKPLANDEEKHVVFLGFSLPDDSRTSGLYRFQGDSSDAKGKTLWCDEVDPRWTDVALNWSVQSSDAQSDAQEQSSSPITWKNIAIPVREDEKLPINQSQTTNRRTNVTLESVEKQKNNVQLHFVLRPQREIGDYRLWVKVQNLNSLDGTAWPRVLNASFPTNRGDGSWNWTVSITGTGAEQQKTFDFPCLLDELSPFWKDQQAVKNVQTRLPAASLLKVSPPRQRTDVPPSAQINTPVQARLEWRDRLSSQTDRLSLWLSPSVPRPHFSWWPLKAVVTEGEGTKHELNIVDNHYFWHSDNTAQSPDEAGWSIYLHGLKDVSPPQKMDVTVDVGRAQVFNALNRFSKIPLPPFGQLRDYKPTEFEGESVVLRRIVWVTDLKEAKRIAGGRGEFNGGARLAMVFEYLPFSTGWRGNPIITRFDFDGVEPEEKRFIFGFANDTGAEKAPQPERLTFLLPLPPRTTKTVSLSLKTNEVLLAPEPPLALVFKGLEVPPKPTPP